MGQQPCGLTLPSSGPAYGGPLKSNVRPHELRHLHYLKGSESTMPSLSSPSMAWSLLLVAGLLEIVWSVSMKASDGFTKHVFTAITLAAAWLSFWLLGLAMKSLPVGTAYAVWTGIGAVGASVLGIVLRSQPRPQESFASRQSWAEFLGLSFCRPLAPERLEVPIRPHALQPGQVRPNPSFKRTRLRRAA